MDERIEHVVGPRVPAVVISPWVERGKVEHETVFDHCSISATVRDLLGIREHLSTREKDAKPVTSLLTRETPRGDDDTPEFPPEARPRAAAEAAPPPIDKRLDDFQIQLLELMDEIEEVPEARRLPPVAEARTARAAAERVESFVERNYPDELLPLARA